MSLSDEESVNERQPLLEPLNGQSDSQSDERKHTTNNFQTFLHILKGNVGPGILALPLAIRNGGYVFGPIALLIIAWMAVHCMQLLVRASRHFCDMFNEKSMDYGQVAKSTLHTYGTVWMRSDILSPYRAHADAGERLVNIFVIIAQFGFCCAYFIFISSNLHQFFHAYGNQWLVEFTDSPYSHSVLTIVLAVPICMICSIRNLDRLSIWSGLANIASMFSLGIIYIFLISTMITANGSDDVNPNKTVEIPERSELEYAPIQSFGFLTLFFGAAIFAFEGITVVLPLENAMERPSDFPKGKFKIVEVLNYGMSLVTFLFLTIGLLGYLAVGDAVEPSITLNLPSDGPGSLLYSLTKLAYSFVVFISFALQFYVPVAFILPWFREKFLQKYEGTSKIIWFELIFRYFLVFVLCTISVLIPHLDDFIALVGAFACSALSLIFPPIMDEFINKEMCRPKIIRVKNISITVFGVFGMVLGTYFAVLELITDIKADFNLGPRLNQTELNNL